MASHLATPVLSVDPRKILQVDTANTQSLHGMWLGKYYYSLYRIILLSYLCYI